MVVVVVVIVPLVTLDRVLVLFQLLVQWYFAGTRHRFFRALEAE